MITNPTPISATFAGMWITALHIIPSSRLSASLHPFDAATGHLLATATKTVTKPSSDPLFLPTVTDISATLAGLAGDDSGIKMVSATAQSPHKPVRILALFASGKTHTIPDAFALAGSDTDFAMVLQTTMGRVAAMANLPIK